MRDAASDWRGFLSQTQLDEAEAPTEPPPTPGRMLAEIATVIAVVLYMTAVILFVAWATGH